MFRAALLGLAFLATPLAASALENTDPEPRTLWERLAAIGGEVSPTLRRAARRQIEADGLIEGLGAGVPIPSGPAFWRRRDFDLYHVNGVHAGRLAALAEAESLARRVLDEDPANTTALSILFRIYDTSTLYAARDSVAVRLAALGGRHPPPMPFGPPIAGEPVPETATAVVPIPMNAREVEAELGPNEVIKAEFGRTLSRIQGGLLAGSVEAVLAAFSPDYLGMPLRRAVLRPAIGDGADDRGRIATARWPGSDPVAGAASMHTAGEDPENHARFGRDAIPLSEDPLPDVDRDGLREAIRIFLRETPFVTHAKFYPIGIESYDRRHIAAWLDFEIDGRDEDARLRHDFARLIVHAESRGGEFRITRIGSISAATSALGDREWFLDQTETAGISKREDPPRRVPWTWEREWGNGLAVGDIDGDGSDDLFVCRPSRSALYRNRGDGTFEDVSDSAGVRIRGDVVNALFVDTRNRGVSDLFVAMAGEPSLFFENRGDGTFVERGAAAGLRATGEPSALTAADFDGDGFVDLFVGMYHETEDLPHMNRAFDAGPDRLYRNLGDGTFVECASEAGVGGPSRTFDAVACDVDDDGRIDLVLANDYSYQQVFRNLGGMRFENLSFRAFGAPVGDVGGAMGLNVGDIDNDGRIDVYISKMTSHSGQRILETESFPNYLHKAIYAKTVSGNEMFQNLGAGVFRDVSVPSGTKDGGWSWGCVFFDYDGNGAQDLVVMNGMKTGEIERDL